MNGEPFYCGISGVLTWITIPLDVMDRPMYYLACQICKRKVVDAQTSYECIVCEKKFEDAVPTYNFSVQVSDSSGALWVNCFGETGDAILGMTAI